MLAQGPSWFFFLGWILGGGLVGIGGGPCLFKLACRFPKQVSRSVGLGYHLWKECGGFFCCFCVFFLKSSVPLFSM